MHSPREGSVLERLGTVAIVGVGLIGGSIGLALRGRGPRPTGGRGRPRPERRWTRHGARGDRRGDDRPGRAGSPRPRSSVVCTPVSRIAARTSRRRRGRPGPAAGHRRGQHQAADRRGRRATSRRVGHVRRRPPDRRLGAIGLDARAGRPVRGPRLRADPDGPDPARPARAGAGVLGGPGLPDARDDARPSTTRSWPTRATCRTPWPRPSRRRSPPEWLAAGRRRVPRRHPRRRRPTPRSGRRSSATTAARC